MTPNCDAGCAVVSVGEPIAILAEGAPGPNFQRLLLLIGIAVLPSMLPVC